MNYRISANVIRRLPRYLRRLDWLEKRQVEKVSSNELGSQMGLTASQIRQDLNCFGGFGQQGYGYNVRQLKENIGEVLGLSEPLTCVVVGAGNLGHALISNFRFSECGFKLAAAFDTAPGLIGKEVAGTPILDAAGLGKYLKEHQVDVGVLTLPQAHTVDTALLMAASGVRGIWNFTGIDIYEDLGNTLVENVHLSDSLLSLGYYLRSQGE